MRFNQLLEIPKLERWFRSDQNPSRQKLINYMNVLNGSNYRRHNTKISYQQICNWFSNQRATNRQSAKANQTNAIQNPSSVVQPLLVTSVQTTMPSDYRPKFDFNTLLENKQANGTASEEFQRIDGGSDSPTPNDDASVHSVSDAGFEHDATMKQESTTSSPELSLDLNGSLASTSPKPRPSPATNGATVNGQMAQSQTPASTVARSRLMFDPLTELPVLERWFEENPHPTWIQIDQYTEALNSCQYRQSYPPISTHNVKIWFKNRRAKCKRMQSGEPVKMIV
uniref:Homeobox domain-containing protein n=1 Tax=Ascaris lumbricoides TaxID=6252 RepID=A0A0M3I8E3_ASCLU